MLTVTDSDLNESEILGRGKLTMLAYIRSDEDCREQFEAVRRVSGAYLEWLEVFVVNEDFINRYNRLQIMGVPTFIIFRDGNERSRILGKADKGRLTDFILNAIPDLITRKRS